jgi:predicted nuclease of predicted toxin-antitoxin system
VQFLADMGVDVHVVEWLRRRGHDAVHLRDEGLHRALDEQVFAKALAEDRIILTFDLDFGDLAALAGERTAQVILFRLENTRTAHVIERLEAVLAASAEALSRGAILIVEEARHRIRRLPIGESEP